MEFGLFRLDSAVYLPTTHSEFALCTEDAEVAAIGVELS